MRLRIDTLCQPSDVLRGMQAMAHWTGLGYRVLGLAVGKLLPSSAADRQQLSNINLLTLKQHVAELRMIGLAIICTQLRPDAERTIKQLHDRSACTSSAVHCTAA